MMNAINESRLTLRSESCRAIGKIALANPFLSRSLSPSTANQDRRGSGASREKKIKEIKNPECEPPLRRDPLEGLQTSESRLGLLRGSLFFTVLITACAVGHPGSAIAQTGFVGDPICGLAHSDGRLHEPADDPHITGALEYDVKAAMLYQCLALVQWPTNAPAGKVETIRIGFLGKNPFPKSLTSLNGKTISGRKLVVKKLSRLRGAARCQAVFISSSETERMAKILDELADLPVLTVGETPGFVEQGGIVNLLLEGKHVRLEINTAAAEKARIMIDPELIKLVPLTADPDTGRPPGE
jgi:hypothetical protein